MSIFCVVLKITLYHEDVAGMITVKNGAALGRNVRSSWGCAGKFICFMARSRGSSGHSPGKAENPGESNGRIFSQASAGLAWVGTALSCKLFSPFLIQRVLAWCGHWTNPKSWVLSPSSSVCKCLGSSAHQSHHRRIPLPFITIISVLTLLQVSSFLLPTTTSLTLLSPWKINF